MTAVYGHVVAATLGHPLVAQPPHQHHTRQGGHAPEGAPQHALHPHDPRAGSRSSDEERRDPRKLRRARERVR